AIVSLSPQGLLNHDVSSFHVVFSEDIDPSTFTDSDVGISGPGGAVDTSQIAVSHSDAHTFDLSLPVLTSEGDYSLTIGPNITDLSGNAMGAAQQGSFTIDKTGPRVTTLNPSGTTTGTIDHFDITFDSAIRAFSLTTTASLTGPGGSINITSITNPSGNT